MQDQNNLVVVGEGWAALGAVGFLAQAGKNVKWVTGTGAHMLPALPTIEVSTGARVWTELANRLGIETKPAAPGSYLREFRNKAFREMPWTKAPTPGDRRDVRDEELWNPERRIAPAFEGRFFCDLLELESQIRTKVLSLPNVQRLENIPVEGIRAEKSVSALVLGSGEEVPASQIIYADRWSKLGALEGLPKPIPFIRNREPMGVLQALFTHHTPIGGDLLEGFTCVMHKDPGEDVERRIWGYFTNGGQNSIWSVFLTSEEVEDNHQIAKKFRRMKQTLDRMFVGPDWLPEDKAEFMLTVSSEQVRFEEAMIFGAGDAPEKSIHLKNGKQEIEGLAFLTDGYGPASAMEQVYHLLGNDLGITIADSEIEDAIALEEGLTPKQNAAT